MAYKLGPIYDAIDMGAYRQALKLIKVAESRHGPDPVLLALKAMALIRADRIDETIDVCERFLQAEPIEPALLETMLPVFKDLNRLDWNTRAYQSACKRCPKHETLLIGLYFAHLRQWSFLSMQQTAMTLYRTFGTDKYAQWAAVCIEVQNGALMPNALIAPSGVIPTVDGPQQRLLALASALLSKVDLLTSTLDARIRIYRRQGHHQAVIDLLKSQPELNAERILTLAMSQFSIGQLDDCIANCRTLLLHHNADDCRFINLFVDAHCATGTLQSARALLHELQQRDERQRGPYLGELRLPQDVKQLHQLILSYFDRFSTRRCFIDDMVQFLNPLDGNNHELLEHLQSVIDRPVIDRCASENEKRIRRQVSYEMCYRHLHHSSSVEELHAKADSLFTLYISSINAGTSLEPTEFGPGDDLCLLCAHTLIDLYETTQQSSYIIQAIYALELALRSSTSNFQYRLLLIRLYCHESIAGFSRAFTHYAALDVKSIQLDTMSHIVQDDALRYGFIAHAKAIADEIIQFHEQYNIDAADLLILAYRCQHLDEVVDFIQFHQRLRLSSRLASARAIRSQCHLLLSHQLDLSSLTALMSEPVDTDLPVIDRQHLLVNDDHQLIKSIFSSSTRSAQLNRPSSFHLSSSWQQHDKPAHGAMLAIHHAIISLLTGHINRQILNDLMIALTDMGIDSPNDPLFTDDGEFIPIDMMTGHWRFVVLLVETAIVINESSSTTISILGHDPSDDEYQSLVDDNRIRWSSIQRQLHMTLMAMELYHGRLITDIGSAQAIPDLVRYSMYAVRLLTVFCHLWGTHISSSMKITSQFHHDIIQSITDTRGHLQSFIVKITSLIDDLYDGIQRFNKAKMMQSMTFNMILSTFSDQSDADEVQSMTNNAIMDSRQLSLKMCSESLEHSSRALHRLTSSPVSSLSLV